MPVLAGIIWGVFLSLVESLVGRIIVALGFGFVEYLGVKTLVDNVRGQADALISGFGGSSLVAWAGFFKIDIHLSIIVSAIGVKLLLSALNSDKIRKLVPKSA